MPLLVSLKALSNTALAQWVQSDTYAFPGLEAVHVISVMLVFGSIAMLDLRLLGLSGRGHGAMRINGEALPWTWAAFVVSVISGTLLFLAQAASYAVNLQFQLKMALIVLAGINLAVFHFLTWKDVRAWNDAPAAPGSARVAAVVSLLCWTGVVVFGRWVGWTLNVH